MRKLFFVLLSGAALGAKAQVDPHFSQYYVYPLWLNPALAGQSEGDYRVSGLYRNQWRNVSTPYSTFGISGDVRTNKNINFGLNILNQTAGTGGYNYTNAYLAVSYSGVRWGGEGQHNLSFGLQGGLLARRFDPSKFQGGDQWVPGVGFNPNIATSDPLTNTSSSSLDLGAGVSYFNSGEQKVNPFVGVSVGHLTQPEDPFIGRGTASRLPMRLTVHGGARVQVGDNAWIVPNALYLRQGNAQEIMLGGYAQLKVNETADLMFGANYRVNDAVSPYVGVLFNRLMLGASYDVNTSQLGKMAGGANSFELSLTFFGKRNEEPSYFKCPRF
ncbi:MAG: type IX secretion system membrane protein PorP/SprF [Chitinophagaceae bacterium]|nr:MAG: type IX secretion system membrane protein PorP/SprF [Chitinophagaceae bacterium]